MQLTVGIKFAELVMRQPAGDTRKGETYQLKCCARELLTYRRCTHRVPRWGRLAAV